MKVYLGFDVPEDWENNPEGYVALLTAESRKNAHQPVAYYVEDA